ncbi:Small auxin-up RNA protein [Dioscorea alata]|uniref:Small auxin-up RNA protein n=1 Tax=Dioscorea alata TaxID=55571 RepID=A0ACB7WU01_DIOAL|nr:Small auxin-up RNA protein [Dioscorea alata]
MARKLMKVPSIKRMISSPRADKLSDFSECSTSCVAEKGHFFVYTSEGKRFMIPLAYLTNNIFKELLRISEEEFGLPGDGPITLPCDAASMEEEECPRRWRCNCLAPSSSLANQHVLCLLLSNLNN